MENQEKSYEDYRNTGYSKSRVLCEKISEIFPKPIAKMLLICLMIIYSIMGIVGLILMGIEGVFIIIKSLLKIDK